MLFLTPADLRGLDPRALEDLLTRSELTIAMGEGDLAGIGAAALLFADYAVLDERASLHIESSDAWAGAVWRLGRGAMRLLLKPRMTAAETRDAGLCDEVTALGAEEWLREWTRDRSVLALDSAAMLIRSRGGDRLERAEFARLFALGEPQKGLGAFLARKKPSF